MKIIKMWIWYHSAYNFSVNTVHTNSKHGYLPNKLSWRHGLHLATHLHLNDSNCIIFTLYINNLHLSSHWFLISCNNNSFYLYLFITLLSITLFYFAFWPSSPFLLTKCLLSHLICCVQTLLSCCYPMMSRLITPHTSESNQTTLHK